ncbi:hypothetical protein SAMN05216524_101583 [Mucilaginibacter sp. OK098]|nr:hypothetical protein SAMN05216524_101583 [Mucilaginibacter sp. OK098]
MFFPISQLMGNKIFLIYIRNILCKLDIPGSLTTSFWNIKNIIPKHFDNANTFMSRINLVIHLTQVHKLGERNHMVKSSGISYHNIGPAPFSAS